MRSTRDEAPGSVDFARVFEEELKWINRRRKQLAREGLDSSEPKPKEEEETEQDEEPEPEEQLERQGTPESDTTAEQSKRSKSETEARLRAGAVAKLQIDALSQDLCGLAISGGGIRSGTFGLGVLQSLASLNMLSRFDYLSTVSGGGYIGSWFSSWINREGFKSVVAKDLLPPRMQPKSTKSDDTVQVEPKPIRHLRLYSNYLAPKPGFLSFDGWVLIAIYLRNLLLNQLILLTAVIAILLAIRAMIEVFSVSHDSSTSISFYMVLSGAATVSLFYGSIAVSFFTPRQPNEDNKRNEHNGIVQPFNLLAFWINCVGPWLLFAVFSSLLFAHPSALQWLDRRTFASYGLSCCICFAASNALLGILTASNRIAGGVVGGFAGSIGGLVFFLSWSGLLSLAQSCNAEVAIIATFGVPLGLFVLILINFLTVGFSARDLDSILGKSNSAIKELGREWWASLNSRLMIVGTSWAAFFGLAIFSPWVFGQIIQPRYGWLSGAAGVGWLGLLSAGIRMASGPGTQEANRGGIKELLAAIAPSFFLTTLIIAVSILSTWLCYDIYAYHISDEKFKLKNQWDNLLSNLDATRAPILDYFDVTCALLLCAALLATSSLAIGYCVGVNTFSLQNLYANRLVRCYLGASQRLRYPNYLVNLAMEDNIPLSSMYPGPNSSAKIPLWQNMNEPEPLPNDSNRQALKEMKHHGPIHLINGALNQGAGTSHNDSSSRVQGKLNCEKEAENLQFVERKAESFVFSPIYCGSESTGYCQTSEFADNLKLGTAMAVSGAAVTPNMGYHSSPSITALLTALNIRLGAWFGNPRLETRKETNPGASAQLLISEMAGLTSANSPYVYVSDGGHFENMGVYELIRRRCRFILAIDAGSDPKFHENVGRIVRQVRIDFGIWIEIDVAPVTPDSNGRCQSHMIVGRICYGDIHKPSVPPSDPYQDDPKFSYSQNHGIIVWIKNSLTGDEPGDLVNFAAMNPSFPYESTLDQFFSESQFESYRALGVHSTLASLSDIKPFIDRKCSTKMIFKNIHDNWIRRPPNWIANYTSLNDAYIEIQELLRTETHLSALADELYGTEEQRGASRAAMEQDLPERRTAERLMANQMFTVLENIWLTLDLSRQSNQPIFEGWVEVFKNWAQSRRLNRCWNDDPIRPAVGTKITAGISQEFSPAFVKFMRDIRLCILKDSYRKIKAQLRSDTSLYCLYKDLYQTPDNDKRQKKHKDVPEPIPKEAEHSIAVSMFILLQDIFLEIDMNYPMHCLTILRWNLVFRNWTAHRSLRGLWKASYPTSSTGSPKNHRLGTVFDDLFVQFLDYACGESNDDNFKKIVASVDGPKLELVYKELFGKNKEIADPKPD